MNPDFEPRYGHPIYRDGNRERGGGFVVMVIEKRNGSRLVSSYTSEH